jgi:hypothetical protein
LIASATALAPSRDLASGQVAISHAALLYACGSSGFMLMACMKSALACAY